MKTQFACATTLWLLSSALFAVDDASCKLGFDLSSAKVNTEALKSCATQLGLKPGQKVNVSAAASSDGNAAQNAALAKTRTSNTALALADLVKGLEVTTESLGVNDSVGRSALIRVPSEISAAALANPVEETLAAADSDDEDALAVAVEIDKEIAPRTASLGESTASLNTGVKAPATMKGDSFRVALRTGGDISWFKNSGKDYYTAPGLDITYIPLQKNSNLRVEIGGLITTYNEEERCV